MRVDDGQWHRVKVLRKRRIGVLQVDKTRPSRGKSEAGASILNTDGKIWIGMNNHNKAKFNYEIAPLSNSGPVKVNQKWLFSGSSLETR